MSSLSGTGDAWSPNYNYKQYNDDDNESSVEERVVKNPCGEKLMTRSAQRYSSYNHKSTFGHIFYRIVQCFKAVFNNSDWQIARRECVVNLKSSRESFVKAKKIKSEYEYNWIAEKMLNHILEQYEDKYSSNTILSKNDFLRLLNADFYLNFGHGMLKKGDKKFLEV